MIKRAIKDILTKDNYLKKLVDDNIRELLKMFGTISIDSSKNYYRLHESYTQNILDRDINYDGIARNIKKWNAIKN